MNIDIKELNDLRDKLEDLEEDDVLFVEENGEKKFAIMTMSQYEMIEAILNPNKITSAPNVRVINTGDIELTYDEYEKVKKQLIEVIDKTFKPKPEKLN